MSKYLTLIGILVFSTCCFANEDDQGIGYPTGFRSWQHVKSGLWLKEHALAGRFRGIHHVYANEIAVEGLQTNTYSDGAILVFDLFDYEDVNKRLDETERKSVDVMVRDSAKFAETGGWGFVTFVGENKAEPLIQDVVKECFACHSRVENSNYVFSKYRE